LRKGCRIGKGRLLSQPEPTYGWNPSTVPEEGELIVRPSWGGLTVKDGIYVTILAPERELMLDAARALQRFSTASP
jgi:hypothetical protein